MFRRIFAIFLVACGALALPSPAHATTLSFAVDAPRESTWGEVFEAWAALIARETEGRVTVSWQYSAGSEGALAAKVQAGALAGASLSPAGLAELDGRVRALSLPGRFSSWSAAAAARSKLGSEAVLAGNGVILAGWYDIGVSRLFAKGFAPDAPATFAGKTAGVLPGDRVNEAVFKELGATVTTKSLGAMAGAFDGGVSAVIAPAYPARQLLWTQKVSHVAAIELSYVSGGLVLAEGALVELSDADRALVRTTAGNVADALGRRLREKDASAWAAIQGELTVVTPTPEQRAAFAAEWKAVCEALRPSLSGGVEAIGGC